MNVSYRDKGVGLPNDLLDVTAPRTNNGPHGRIWNTDLTNVHGGCLMGHGVIAVVVVLVAG